MILIPHLIISGVIAANISFWPLALILAFFSHYLLDFLPHNEYLINNIKQRKWITAGPDFLKLSIDFIIGFGFLVLIHYIKNTSYYILFVAGIMGILPDMLYFFSFTYRNNKILKWNSFLHEKIHFFKDKKISGMWRTLIQIATVLLALAFLI